MWIALAVVLGILALNFALLYRLACRERSALVEYTQFLLMHPDSYPDQRQKFLDYLATTKGKSAERRSLEAAKSVTNLAEGLKPHIFLANIGLRNSPAARP